MTEGNPHHGYAVSGDGGPDPRLGSHVAWPLSVPATPSGQRRSSDGFGPMNRAAVNPTARRAPFRTPDLLVNSVESAGRAEFVEGCDRHSTDRTRLETHNSHRPSMLRKLPI